MATGVFYWRAALYCVFLWAKGLTAKNIYKEMFPVYCGKCLPRTAVHNWVEKFSQGGSRVADDARPGAEVAETKVKRLLCCGFRRIAKAMGQVYQCWWICREIHGFPRFEYHMFYVLYPFVTYLLTLPCNKQGHDDSSRRRHLDEDGWGSPLSLVSTARMRTWKWSTRREGRTENATPVSFSYASDWIHITVILWAGLHQYS
jgi:hypothetical protein